jgi:predicted deacylase
MIILLIIVVILILVISSFYFLSRPNLNKICNHLEYFTYSGDNAGTKTILILGGIHGNEPAGSNAIIDLMDDFNNKKINLKNNKLILVPNVNYCALRINKRMIDSIGDLNRKFPKNKKDDKDLNPVIKQLLELINKADFIIDFHEGWGYYKENNGSIGSTLTPTNTKESMEVTKKAFENVNSLISNYNKKFTILTDSDTLAKQNSKMYGKDYDIEGTLRYYANKINKNYMLVEISGQNDIQPMDVRIKQGRSIIDSVLYYYNCL